MCRRINCDRCGKPTFAGCGAHIEQVLAGVPHDQRCKCREAASNGSGSGNGAATPPRADR